MSDFRASEVRACEFDVVSAAMSKIKQPPLHYSTLNDRQRRDCLKPANEALEKVSLISRLHCKHLSLTYFWSQFFDLHKVILI